MLKLVVHASVRNVFCFRLTEWTHHSVTTRVYGFQDEVFPLLTEAYAYVASAPTDHRRATTARSREATAEAPTTNRA